MVINILNIGWQCCKSAPVPNHWYSASLMAALQRLGTHITLGKRVTRKCHHRSHVMKIPRVCNNTIVYSVSLALAFFLTTELQIIQYYVVWKGVVQGFLGFSYFSSCSLNSFLQKIKPNFPTLQIRSIKHVGCIYLQKILCYRIWRFNKTFLFCFSS